MPIPHSHANVLNATDTTLVRDESFTEFADADYVPKKLHRRVSGLLNTSSNDDSFKRLPMSDDSMKKLPMGDVLNESHKKLPGISRLKDDQSNDSFKRLPSISRRNSVLGNNDETPELKRQQSISSKMMPLGDESGTTKRGLTMKEFANTSGDLLRQVSITRRNSVASEDLRPSLTRKPSIVSSLMKVMRWAEESENDKKRRQVKTWEDFALIYKVIYHYTALKLIIKKSLERCSFR